MQREIVGLIHSAFIVRHQW